MEAEIQAIANTLIKRAKALHRAPKAFVTFTNERKADELLNDLNSHPHAFVLGCVMDRQIKAEKAWEIPYRLKVALRSFSMTRLRKLDQQQVLKLMTHPHKLHRYPREMSRNFYEGVQLIAERYACDAAAIWADRPSSAEVVYRMLEFRGVGPKIATMTANILVRHFKIKFSDYYSIDVSVDVQVRRVLTRLGVIESGESNEQVVFKARALSPQFPGLLDLPAWEIGRMWCRPLRPKCSECYMKNLCPTARKTHERGS